MFYILLYAAPLYFLDAYFGVSILTSLMYTTASFTVAWDDYHKQLLPAGAVAVVKKGPAGTLGLWLMLMRRMFVWDSVRD